MKITFLLPVVSHVRYQKRIGALVRLGIVPNILAFERSYYNGKPWPDGYTSLGKISHGRYLRRVIAFARAFHLVRASLRKTGATYVFGLDLLFLAWLCHFGLRARPHIFYEVGDLGILPGKRAFSFFLRFVERFLLKRISLLIVTSQAYIDKYYFGVQKLKRTPYLVIENKVDEGIVAKHTGVSTHLESPYNQEGGVRIGYFGLIRCRRSWEALEIATKMGRGKVKVYVRGIPLGLDSFIDDVHSNRYITYDGPYVSPDDLSKLYDQVDIVWIAHHMSKTSLKMNRANRFYEACFFKKPMIAQIGTQDAKDVNVYKIGTSVDLSNIGDAVNRILKIDTANISQWRENIVEIPRQVFLYTDEHQMLFEAITKG